MCPQLHLFDRKVHPLIQSNDYLMTQIEAGRGTVDNKGKSISGRHSDPEQGI